MTKHKRHSREGWHPQGSDYVPTLDRGAILHGAKGLQTMCEAEHKAKLADISKAQQDGIKLTKEQAAYVAKVNG